MNIADVRNSHALLSETNMENDMLLCPVYNHDWMDINSLSIPVYNYEYVTYMDINCVNVANNFYIPFVLESVHIVPQYVNPLTQNTPIFRNTYFDDNEHKDDDETDGVIECCVCLEEVENANYNYAHKIRRSHPLCIVCKKKMHCDDNLDIKCPVCRETIGKVIVEY